jgi:type IV secretory pathway VirB10-like protein
MSFTSIPRKYKLLGVGLLLAAALAVTFFIVLSRGEAPGPSGAEGLADGLSGSDVGGEGTPEYNLLVEGENDRKAAEARVSGESFAPVPVGGGGFPADRPLSPLVRGPSRANPAAVPRAEAPAAPVMRPRPEAPRAEPRRAAGQGQPAEREARPYADRALSADLKAVMDRSARRSVPTVKVYGPTGGPAGERAAGKEAPVVPKIPAGLSPGKILYAVTDIGLSSDVPAPVVATVAEGPLKGAKALGSFRAERDSVVIAFTRIVPEGAPEIKVEAVGVDPDLSFPNVRASVDTHFWERWGSLVASSFLEGLGGAASGRRTRVYVSGDTVVEEGIGKTMRDMALEAAGKVGERAAAQAEKGFDRPPTVTVRPGEHVGILILTVG